MNSRLRKTGFLALALMGLWAGPILAGPAQWAAEFPDTDFTKRSVPYAEIRSDGATKDSIPPINDPKFVAAADAKDIGRLEPVLGIGINGDFRAYPLRILLWHEIVNDTVGGVPVLVSYCPLCNSGVIFDRRLDGRALVFGNTGRLRHFDMVMYDKKTSSWWQQFAGQAIMGELTGRTLKALPSRLESFERFLQRAPEGKVLVPNDPASRKYGTTPYVRMEKGRMPVRYSLPKGIRALDRAIIVGKRAWPLKRLKQKRYLDAGDLILIWAPGQNSIHDTKWIPFGRDVGNVIVRRKQDGKLVDTPYDVTFAFAFSAFVPRGKWELP